jgi:hypothetical protein
MLLLIRFKTPESSKEKLYAFLTAITTDHQDA